MRGYSSGAKPRVQCKNGRLGGRDINEKRHARTMHATHNLTKSLVKRTQAALASGRFMPSVFTFIMRIVPMCRVRFRTATCVPGGMHNCALLRNQQQGNTKIMEKAA